MYLCIISTVEVPIGTLKVSISTLNSFVQFYFLARFELFLSVFLSWELYLDMSWTIFLIKLTLT